MARLISLLPILSGAASAAAFAPPPIDVTLRPPSRAFVVTSRPMADVATGTAADGGAVSASVEPKDAVKLFGRLAEKYIMLDASGGMCCYSACSDCEYRKPDGGYIMADQSAGRPKWIPCYERREFETLGKEHTSRWSAEIFTDGPAVTKDQFVSAIAGMTFATPLGGPFVSNSAGKTMEDASAAEALFEVLAGEKEKLTKHRMQTRMKEIAGGEEGLTWPKFSAALGVE